MVVVSAFEVGERGGRLRARLERALSTADPRLERLAHAMTSVCVRVTDDREESVTLLLDRNPPQVVDGTEPAEITIELTGSEAQAMADGELVLAPELYGGQIPYRGPIRKFLVVEPVLRAILAGLDAGPREPPPSPDW